MTIVSGTMTGLAAACSSRSYGSAERDIASTCDHRGRIGSRCQAARQQHADIDRPGSRPSIAALIVRVATSIMPVSSPLPVTLSSSSTSTQKQR
jgi:hypothetical protein